MHRRPDAFGPSASQKFQRVKRVSVSVGLMGQARDGRDSGRFQTVEYGPRG